MRLNTALFSIYDRYDVLTKDINERKENFIVKLFFLSEICLN